MDDEDWFDPTAIIIHPEYFIQISKMLHKFRTLWNTLENTLDKSWQIWNILERSMTQSIPNVNVIIEMLKIQKCTNKLLIMAWRSF